MLKDAHIWETEIQNDLNQKLQSRIWDHFEADLHKLNKDQLAELTFSLSNIDAKKFPVVASYAKAFLENIKG